MALVEIDNLSKKFGGLCALKDLTMEVEQGEIRGLIGPNGAGKTTLFNILAGNYQASSGSLRFAGRDISRLRNDERVALGIARTFQNIRLFSSMTVLENVKLGFHARTKTGWIQAMLRWQLTNQEEKETDAAARDLLDDLDLSDLADENAKNLAYGNQRRLEIARALASRPQLLLLDEPAAGLNEAESKELIGRIRTIRSQGITVIIVEHDMRLVMNLCDRITVLAHGEKIAEGTPQEVQNDQRVRVEYLGKEGEHAQDTTSRSLLRESQSA